MCELFWESPKGAIFIVTVLPHMLIILAKNKRVFLENFQFFSTLIVSALSF